MSTKQSGGKQLHQHSEIKVKLLSLYLDRFLNIIANNGYTKKVKIFDLFCGDGIYEDGGKGSPIVILDAIKRMDDEHRHIAIDCTFNDIKVEKTERLEKIIYESDYKTPSLKSIRFTNDNYKDIIQGLKNDIVNGKDEKAFIFIDPYGYKEIRASDIKGLLENKDVEVLLFLPTSFMYRFNKNGTPESLMAFIDELIDINNFDTSNVWVFIDNLKKGFKKNLGDDIFVDTFTIHKDQQTVFCLFFFSTHIKGFEKMLEAKWEIDKEQGKGWEFHDHGDSLFMAQTTNPLRDKLVSFLNFKGRTNGEIYDFTLHSGFLPKHCVEVLKAMQNNNQISVVEKGGKAARKGAFYVSYDNYKNNHDKVTIKYLLYGTK